MSSGDVEIPEEELEDIANLPDDWQDFVLQRLEMKKVAARRRDSSDRKTIDEVFDKATLMVLYKFISGGFVETIDYPVSTGKEANVFHASTPRGDAIAVKIFRTNTATFRSFMTYIAGDPRFGHVRPNRRDIVYTWAQKEYKNLQRYYEAGVLVPQPFAWRQNVILMDFIGGEGMPWPRIKDDPPQDPAAAFDWLVEQYRLGVEKAGLVHGDLSEYNVLGLDGKMVIIDVAQSVLTHHPMSRELIERDARNLTAYFRRLGHAVEPAEAMARMRPPPSDDESDDDE